MIKEQCLNCKNLMPITGGCKAYPEGIPYKFSSDQEQHNKIEPDQENGFVFEEGKPEQLKSLKKGS